MSANSSEATKTQNAAVRDAAERNLEEEQRALTLALTSHPDPLTRLIAHMSERQLSLVEVITAMRRETNESLRDLHAKVDTLTGRQDTLENRYNGQGYDAAASANAE